MPEFTNIEQREAHFHACQNGNSNQQLSDMAALAREMQTKPFEPVEEAAHLKRLAFDAMHSDVQADRDKVANEIARLHQLPLLESQVLEKASEPDINRQLPVAKVTFNAIGGMEKISFEPGCLDFDAKTNEIGFTFYEPK